MTPPVEAIDPIPTISPVQAVGMPGTEVIAAAGSAPDPTAAQAQLNVAILQASVDVSINSGNESLALLLQTAIAGINDILEPTFGPNAIENTASQDNTPEGTAERIVSLSTGFYEAFKQQHPGAPEAEVLAQFMATIRSGFEQGFKEARDILQGMNVLSENIATNIDKTYSLVLQGYADFATAQGSDSSAASGKP